MRLRRTPTLADRVYSVLPPKSYACRDVTACEDHIRDLSARIAAINRGPESALTLALRADQDALLDHRAALKEMERQW
jgi:hypothetical protein